MTSAAMPVEENNSDATALTESAANKVVIIGAGIAGLSCGCYLQMNGIPTEILEASLLPGGLCTSWHRGPYIFDGCLRWLMGVQPPSAFHQIWTELGAIAGRKIFVHDDMLRIEWPDGKNFSVPADLDTVAAEFKNLAPEDGGLIDQLVRDARRCAPLEPPLENPLELLNLFEKTLLGLRYLPMVPAVFRYKNLLITEYVARYKNKMLREVLQAHRRQRGHVGAGAGDAAGVSDAAGTPASWPAARGILRWPSRTATKNSAARCGSTPARLR